MRNHPVPTVRRLGVAILALGILIVAASLIRVGEAMAGGDRPSIARVLWFAFGGVLVVAFGYCVRSGERHGRGYLLAALGPMFLGLLTPIGLAMLAINVSAVILAKRDHQAAPSDGVRV